VQAPGQVQRGSREGSECSGEGLGGFGAKPGHLQRGFGAEPGQVQKGFGEGSGEGLGSFDAKPGQVQQGSEEGSGEGLGARARSGSTGFRKRFRRRSEAEKVWEASVQSQVRFNRVPEKVPEKVWEALVQSQFRFNRICARLIHGNPAEVFPALGFSARFRTICKNKTLRLLGIPQNLILVGHSWILNCGN